MYDPTTGRFINEDPIRDGYNWYVYCNGNPIMFVDPSGLDAIFLTNETAVDSGDYIGDIGRGNYFGHTAVIVQNTEGEWYYFSWAKDYVDFIKVDTWALNSLDNFNYWLGVYAYDYTISTYIGGNFSDSIAYFESLAGNYVDENGEQLERGAENTKYNAFYNNCLQVVIDGLDKGMLADGKTSFKSYIKGQGYIIPKGHLGRPFGDVHFLVLFLLI